MASLITNIINKTEEVLHDVREYVKETIEPATRSAVQVGYAMGLGGELSYARSDYSTYFHTRIRPPSLAMTCALIGGTTGFIYSAGIDPTLSKFFDWKSDADSVIIRTSTVASAVCFYAIANNNVSQ